MGTPAPEDARWKIEMKPLNDTLTEYDSRIFPILYGISLRIILSDSFRNKNIGFSVLNTSGAHNPQTRLKATLSTPNGNVRYPSHVHGSTPRKVGSLY